MGAGIAIDFQKKFGLRRKILANGYIHRKHPTCIKVGRVFNLITKELYWHKPTYESLKGALEIMKEIIIEEDIHCLAMPKIGSGLDRLSWAKVREIIKEVFQDIDIEIVICSL